MAGCFLSKVSHGVSALLSAWAVASSKGSTGQGESAFKPTHTVSGRSQFLVMYTSTGLSHDGAAGFSQGKKYKRNRERKMETINFL